MLQGVIKNKVGMVHALVLLILGVLKHAPYGSLGWEKSFGAYAPAIKGLEGETCLEIYIIRTGIVI